MTLTYDYEWSYLQAGLEQLENYLLSKELFWPPGVSAARGQPPYPQLTLGNLLLSHQRLKALARTPAQQAELLKAEQSLERLRTRWRSAWTNKARQEFRQRLIMWRDFLEEYRESPLMHQDRFRYEISRRVVLDLLQWEAEQLPEAEIELLESLDRVLKALFRPGSFLWQQDLASAFPSDRFWYLYGSLTFGV